MTSLPCFYQSVDSILSQCSEAGITSSSINRDNGPSDDITTMSLPSSNDDNRVVSTTENKISTNCQATDVASIIVAKYQETQKYKDLAKAATSDLRRYKEKRNAASRRAYSKQHGFQGGDYNGAAKKQQSGV